MTILNTYGRQLGPDLQNGSNPLLLAVLTVGHVDDYAVYEGIVPAGMDRDAAARAVAARGSKCSYKRALTYFPDLPEDKYRR